MITRALGTDPDVDVDTFAVEAQAGDVFLLCSDGLTTMVDDETILDVVERNRGDLDAAAKALVEAANRGGGEDNITVVLFEIGEAGGRRRPAPGARRRRGAGRDDEDTLSELDAVPAIDDDGRPRRADRSTRGRLAAPPARSTARRRRAAAARGTALPRIALWSAPGLRRAARRALVVWGLSRATSSAPSPTATSPSTRASRGTSIGGAAPLPRRLRQRPAARRCSSSQAERRRLFDHNLRARTAARAAVAALRARGRARER